MDDNCREPVGDQNRTTAQEVAAMAGVSRSAVSRAFTPGASISPATKEKVMHAAIQLQYVPNTAARSLMTRRTNLIAILVSHQSNALFDQMLDHINRGLESVGYHAFLMTAFDSDDENDDLQRLFSYPIDGLIVTAAGSLSFSERICRICKKFGMPAVTLNRVMAGVDYSAIICDHRGCGALAADALIDAGSLQLAIIVGAEKTTTNLERLRGFLDQVASRGYPVPIVERAPSFTYEGGCVAAARLFQAAPGIDGLYCVNDLLAIGAMEMVKRDLGRRVPDDLFVVGCDNMPYGAWPSYDLTTIRQPVADMAAAAVDAILAEIAGLTDQRRKIVLPVELVERGSTRRGG